MREGRLSAKRALVFGAGPNIGGTIAHFIAREGARVAVADVNAQAVSRKQRPPSCERGGMMRSPSWPTSLTKRPSKRAVAETTTRLGGLEIMVNMAGKTKFTPIVDLSLAEWNEYFTSFPTAGMLTTKHAARAMIAAGNGGSIIHLLSTAAHFGQAAAAT